MSAQHRLSTAVNSAMVTTYWEIGEQIFKACGENDRAEYGKKLLEYLQNNHADYIFTITNVGDGSIDGRYWVITNDQLYILRYNKDIDELFSVEAMEFMTDNIEFFEYPWEKQ